MGYNGVAADDGAAFAAGEVARAMGSDAAFAAAEVAQAAGSVAACAAAELAWLARSTRLTHSFANYQIFSPYNVLHSYF